MVCLLPMQSYANANEDKSKRPWLHDFYAYHNLDIDTVTDEEWLRAKRWNKCQLTLPSVSIYTGGIYATKNKQHRDGVIENAEGLFGDRDGGVDEKVDLMAIDVVQSMWPQWQEDNFQIEQAFWQRCMAIDAAEFE